MLKYKKKEKQTRGILCRINNKQIAAIRKGRRRKLREGKENHLHISNEITLINYL
jgi:hypothetical protein